MPPISAAQLAAIMPPPPSESDRSRGGGVSAPVVWAGVGTIAAAMLIALGVWLSRSGPSASKAAPTASPAPAPTATPVASPTPAATATPAPDSNLIANGDLETVDGKGHLTGWSVSERNAASVHLLDEDGTRFLRLNNDDPSRSVVADQKVDLDPSYRDRDLTTARQLPCSSSSSSS